MHAAVALEAGSEVVERVGARAERSAATAAVMLGCSLASYSVR
jgi:hypothetical protein